MKINKNYGFNRSKFARLRLLRVLIPLLKIFNFEFRWRHDLTHQGFKLRLFDHKGYWFYGQSREIQELEFIQNSVREGYSVLEIGAHIGYFTQYFECLVGTRGRVLAIEPTPSSFELLRQNVNDRTELVCKACSDKVGLHDFFLEKFGGFTNSLSAQYTSRQNRQHNFHQKISAEVETIKVSTDTVDNLCAQYQFSPDFIKVDAEGAELAILRGGLRSFHTASALMIEVTDSHHEICSLLSGLQFKCLNRDCYTESVLFFKKC